MRGSGVARGAGGAVGAVGALAPEAPSTCVSTLGWTVSGPSVAARRATMARPYPRCPPRPHSRTAHRRGRPGGSAPAACTLGSETDWPGSVIQFVVWAVPKRAVLPDHFEHDLCSLLQLTLPALVWFLLLWLLYAGSLAGRSFAAVAATLLWSIFSELRLDCIWTV